MIDRMTRLAPVSPPYEASVVEDLTKLMPAGVPPLQLFRTLAHNPRVLRRVRKGGLLDPGAISLRDRELVILRTTALCGSEYEWGVHVAFFGAAAGFTAAQIAATVTGDVEPFSEAERPVLALCAALHQAARVPDELWAELAARYQPDQLVELVALAGQYHMISFVTNALGVALEPMAPRFPPGA
jgi:4-carboxymuconolactone decarboxylase